MTRDEFTNKVKEVRSNLTDEALAGDLLTEIFEGVTNVFESNTTLNNQVDEYVKSNENLRESNMKLFLKLGDESDKTDPDAGSPEPEPQPEKRKFEDLFKD